MRNLSNGTTFNSIQLVYFRQRGPYKMNKQIDYVGRWTDRKQQTGRTAQHKKKHIKNLRKRMEKTDA